MDTKSKNKYIIHGQWTLRINKPTVDTKSKNINTWTKDAKSK